MSKMNSGDRKAVVASIKASESCHVGMQGELYWGQKSAPNQFQMIAHITLGNVMNLNKNSVRLGSWDYNQKDWDFIKSALLRTALKH